MSETKFTQGPWSVEVNEYETGSGQIAIPEINRILHDPEWADPKDWDRDLANARLIAAAPDLLAELKRADRLILKMATVILQKKCADYIPHGLEGETREYLRSGTPAIAKAEGRA